MLYYQLFTLILERAGHELNSPLKSLSRCLPPDLPITLFGGISLGLWQNFSEQD